MSDRLRFRIWDGKQWHYSLVRANFRGGQITPQEGDVISQCTGLRDHNGVLIWEWDVVRLGPTWYGYADVITWGHVHPSFFIGKEALSAGECKKGEVIGDIYANPELLPPACCIVNGACKDQFCRSTAKWSSCEYDNRTPELRAQ